MGANDKLAAALNQCDDEQPMGEDPDLPPYARRSGAAAVFSALAATDAAVKHAENLQAAVNDIRGLHGRRPLIIRGTTVEKWKCGTCDVEHPCPTITALDRHGV